MAGLASDPAYDTDTEPVDIGIYAEIERFCEGETTPGAGHYNCRLFLTEESFHRSGENEGYWLSVLACDALHFDLLGPASVVPPLSGPSVLDQVSPNPFRSIIAAAFSLGEVTWVDLALYDVTGTRVAELVSGVASAGDHIAHWDGGSASGRKAAPGVCFCRLLAGDRIAFRKIVLID